jgi:O-antigen/teichoic acid export membrane protein
MSEISKCVTETSASARVNMRAIPLKMPSLKINALSNLLTLGANIIVGLLLMPVVLSHLGEKQFGIWMLVTSFVGYFGMLRFGVSTGVLRYVPLYRGQSQTNKVNEVISTGMAFYLLVGVFIFAVSVLFDEYIAAFFKGGPELATLVWLCGLAAAIECPALIFDAAMRSYEAFWLVNIVTIVLALLRAAVLYTSVLLGYGLICMGWIQVAFSVIGLAANWIAFEFCCSDVRLSARKIGLPVLKMLLVYGIVIVIEGAAGTIAIESPKLVVGKVISLEAVGFFGAVWYLMLYYQRVIFSLTRVLMPRFSFLSGQDAHQDIQRLFFLSSRYSTIAAGAIALLLWVLGPSFLLLWLKDDNIRRSFLALMILSAGNVVFLSHRISVDLLFGLGKQKELAVFAIIEAIAVFTLCVVLSYKYGLTGVAVGAAVPIALVRGIVQARYVCRLVGVGFWKYYNDCIFRPWIIAIIFAVAAWSLGVEKLVKGWMSIIVASTFITLVYSVVIYLTVIDYKERLQLKNGLSASVNFVFDKLALIFLMPKKVRDENTSGVSDL